MPESDAKQRNSDLSAQNWFTSTHWSVVLSAREGLSLTSQAALERLCRAYWPPIYAFLRRKGHAPPDAQDLAKVFRPVAAARDVCGCGSQRGRFRTFLLSALSCFLIDEHRRATRQKRGGGEQPISLDDEQAEELYLEVPGPGLNPDQMFDRRWRLALLQQALRRLENEFAAAGKQRQFTLLKEFLTGPASVGAYDPIAAELGTSPRTIAVTIHRLRQRFRELVRRKWHKQSQTHGSSDE
jgi:RNA polymerase sigma-70 factor (ECF subfamily)